MTARALALVCDALSVHGRWRNEQMSKVLTSIAIFFTLAFVDGCSDEVVDVSDSDVELRSGDTGGEFPCHVTEENAVGDILATDCGNDSCEAGRHCCWPSGGCFCHPTDYRCPNGSKKAPCQPGQSCEP